MSEPTKAAGYLAQVSLDGTFVGVRNFRVNRRVNIAEVGDTEDGRYERQKALRKTAQVSFTVIADPSILPHLTYSVVEGAYVALLYYPFGVDATSPYDAELVIQEVGDSMDVGGLVEFNITALTNGPYVLPGDSEARD